MERSKLIAGGAALGILASMVILGSALYAGEGNEQRFNGSIEVARGADYAKLARISVIGVNRSIEKKYPKSTVKSIRLQEENGYLVYEVLLLNKGRNLDVKVDAGNGEILKVDNDRERRDNGEGAGEDNGNIRQAPMYKGSISVKGSQEANMYNLAKISPNEAMKSALSRFSGKVIEVKLDNENGALIYSVRMVSPKGTVTDVKVDAGNGKVLSSDNGGYRESEGTYQDERRHEARDQENENSED